MSDDFTFGDLIREGAIIDNRRVFLGTRITLKDVLKRLAEGSQGFKSAVGYFYIEGLSEIVYSLRQLKDIKCIIAPKKWGYAGDISICVGNFSFVCIEK